MISKLSIPQTAMELGTVEIWLGTGAQPCQQKTYRAALGLSSSAGLACCAWVLDKRAIHPAQGTVAPAMSS